MNLKKALLSCLVIFALLVNYVYSAEETLTIFSPNYFGEEKNIFEPIHYLENEMLSFKICLDKNAQNIEAKIVCKNKKETIKLYKDQKSPGCFFNNYNLENALCSNFKLNIEYILDSKERKVIRDFEKQKESKLINHILEKNYNNLNDKEKSYYLFVLADVEGINSKKSNEIYEKLKESRNNNEKCWPKTSCNPKTTAIILNNLKKAGYSLNSRLLEDGKLYIEKKIINNENNPLRFTISIDDNLNSSNKISCSLKIDSNSDKNYIFDDNSSIEEFASETISFNCNKSVNKINFKLYNIKDNLKLSKEYLNANSFSYNIEKFACFGENNCDFESSVYILDTYGSTIKDASLIQNYLDSLIITDNNQKKIDSASPYKDTGKYLIIKQNTELVDYLKFKQNNDGSWGSGSIYDKISQTAWAILGLEKSSGSSEHLKDAKNWVYFKEPHSGWGSLLKNSLAYEAIKEQIKPYLKITTLNEIENITTIKIENPTIHYIKNLKITSSPEISEFLTYKEDLGDLEGKGNLTFNISFSKNFFGTKSGKISIEGLNGKNNLIKLSSFPINLIGKKPFELEIKNSNVNDKKNFIEINIIKNTEKFSANCNYENPFNKKIINTQINEKTTTIKIENKNLISGNFNTTFSCEIEKSFFEIKIPLNTSVSKKEFNILTTPITIDSTFDFTIKIKNTKPTKQILTFDIDGDLSGIIVPAEKDKVIAPNDTREIFFTIKNKNLLLVLNNTNSNIIVKGENGYIEKIPIFLNLKQNTEKNNLSGWKLYAVIFVSLLIISFIGLIIYRFYELKKKPAPNENENTNDEYYYDDDIEFK